MFHRQPGKTAALLFPIAFVLSACISDSGSSSGWGNENGEFGSPGDPRSVTLSWTPPSHRADADETPLSLSEIAGYEIHYGTESGNYTESRDLNKGSTAQATLARLEPDTYYFAVKAYDHQGARSELSEEASATVTDEGGDSGETENGWKDADNEDSQNVWGSQDG